MMKFKGLTLEKTLVLAFFLLLISARLVHAADIELKSGCDLGQAIRSANFDATRGNCTAGSGVDTITLNADVTREDATAFPRIRSEMIIQSAEGEQYALSGNDNAHLFTVSGSGGKLTINSLIITNGRNSSGLYGGAIRVIQGGTLTLNNSVVKDSQDNNTVSGTGGGAIYLNSGSLILNSSTVSDNEVEHDGGGIRAAYNSAVTINKSTISGNSANRGGGIFITGGSLDINNSTIYNNSATSHGGGIFAGSGSTSTLTHVTLSENQAASNNGGGIFVAAAEGETPGATVKLRNSIIANSAGGGDCVGALNENINSLIEDGSCATGATNFLTGDPALGEQMMMSPAYFPLQDKSPAIGAGAADHCLDNDQPGSDRPESACDIGAYENARSAPATTANQPESDSDDDTAETPQIETCKTLPERFLVTATHVGVQCQELDASEIGSKQVIDADFIAALDIWAYLGPGVEVCFRESGFLLFLDTAITPRVVSPLPSYISRGMTCGWINRPGQVVLVPPSASLALLPETDLIMTLENCSVTTADGLNLRDNPAGSTIGLIPNHVSLAAIARSPNWFKVDNRGVLGWISAEYVNMQGGCGPR